VDDEAGGAATILDGADDRVERFLGEAVRLKLPPPFGVWASAAIAIFTASAIRAESIPTSSGFFFCQSRRSGK